ncbi:hypothetical protein [Candidatus Viadribacter manganicus]|uniref:Uncharacterized protein n=1 Tax=Candidatus Viadribacter manganicus TaxID=1759059 RepID=A0A1B1AJP3_9PROT|nr:hypothetical protein [Candidatus Viadribacter manganicus]ANP46773.1 hypothetical protein ATE48_13045 [Candidatus Viadribacter manganicus]
MTRARFFYPEVRLKRLLKEPGGLRVVDALDRADAAIDAIRDDCLLAIDGKIAAISSAAKREGHPDARYTLSNEIYAEAGALGLAELSDVAHNLCELLSLERKEDVSEQAVRVHVDAMRALRSPAVSANGTLRRAVLAELHRLAARLAAASTR